MTLVAAITEFYDVFPSSDHQPGDIWSGLPTFGMLPHKHGPGLVITPACDLSNRKVESITYLPIVPVTNYLCSRSCLSDVLRVIDGQAAAGGLALRSKNQNEPLRVADLVAYRELLTEHVSRPSLGAKERAACQRAFQGIELAIAALTGKGAEIQVQTLRQAFSDKELGEISRKVVTNAFRSDVHFLPQDEQPDAWSIIKMPSVVLFRYPQTIPIEVLDEANTSSEGSWGASIEGLAGLCPGISAFSQSLPMKYLRVKQRFLPDLISRFTTLYGRMGSPDFAASTIDRLVTQIGQIP